MNNITPVSNNDKLFLNLKSLGIKVLDNTHLGKLISYLQYKEHITFGLHEESVESVHMNRKSNQNVFTQSSKVESYKIDVF